MIGIIIFVATAIVGVLLAIVTADAIFSNQRKWGENR